MKRQHVSPFSRTGAIVTASFLLASMFAPAYAEASLINQSLTLSNHVKVQTATYTITFTPQSSTAIKKFNLYFELNSSGGTPPPGVDTGGATLVSVSGIGGTWFLNTASGNYLPVQNSAAAATPSGPITIVISGVKNPSLSGTFYLDESSQDSSFTDIEYGTSRPTYTIGDASVALSASIGETLTFSISTSTTVALPAFTIGSVSTGTTTFTVGTNATNGYAVSGIATTLQAGPKTIPFIASGGTVTAGTSNFGVRMTTCPATCTYTATDASLGSQVDLMTRSTTASADTGVVTYRVAVSNTQAAGNYSSTVTYIATGLF